MDPDIILLQQQARLLGIDLNDQHLEKFAVYKNELLLWNAKTNLVSENSSQAIITRHFLDSLTALQFIPRHNTRIIDVGSGAGFPGIPLKIARPSLAICLLESNRKKVSFLKHILRILNFDNAVVLHERVENVTRTDEWKEKFDILISRAAFKLDELLPLGKYFLSSGGSVIALKSRNVDEEIRRCSRLENRNKISQLIQHDIKADFLGASRKIIVIKK